MQGCGSDSVPSTRLLPDGPRHACGTRSEPRHPGPRPWGLLSSDGNPESAWILLSLLDKGLMAPTEV